jgi:hypothetical protein
LDGLGCSFFNPVAKRSSESLAVRAQSKWTATGVVLWLIAAVAATLLVCSETAPPPEAAATPQGDEVEVELVE